MATERPPSFVWELYVAYQRIGQLLTAGLADSEVGAEDYALYSRLATHGPATPTELAADIGIPRSTLMLRFKRLLERGHAAQIPNPLDGRSSLLTLTPEGRRAQEATLPQFRSIVSGLARELRIPYDGLADMLAELARASEAALLASEEAKIREARQRAAAGVDR